MLLVSDFQADGNSALGKEKQSMKRIRRLTLMAISTLFIALTVSGTALAASKYYVPVEGKMYRYEGKSWGKEAGKFTATFSKDGKLKKEEVYIGGVLERRVENKWKGNYLTKSTKTSLLGHQPDTLIETVSYTYKNGKLSKSKNTMKTRRKTIDKSSTTCKWKKNKGTMTRSNGQKYSITLKKGRVSKAKEKDKKYNYTSTYTYYGNYLMKKSSTKSDTAYKETKYNKYGLPVSEIEKSYIMNASGSVTFTYNWTIKNGVPKEVVVTRHHSPSDVDVIYKWVFTKTKQVSKLRNCDRYGHLTDIYISARY